MFLNIILTILAILVFLVFIRAVKGPKPADRIVAANMLGTLVITIIALLSVKLRESYLADICILYAMLSFVAVIVMTKVYRKDSKEES